MREKAIHTAMGSWRHTQLPSPGVPSSPCYPVCRLSGRGRLEHWTDLGEKDHVIFHLFLLLNWCLEGCLLGWRLGGFGFDGLSPHSLGKVLPLEWPGFWIISVLWLSEIRNDIKPTQLLRAWLLMTELVCCGSVWMWHQSQRWRECYGEEMMF